MVTAAPALAQGKSQETHGQSGRRHWPPRARLELRRRRRATAESPSPPSHSVLAAAAGASSSTPATPFAWLDTANLMAPGSIWVGISAVRWQGAGLSEVSFPVVDAAFGVTPRLQIGASVPRVRTSGELEGPQGGMGTTFLNGKIGILTDSERPLKVAVTPTFEILSQAAMQWMPTDRNRVQWGLPVSLEIDRGVSRDLRLDRLLLTRRVVCRRRCGHTGRFACRRVGLVQPGVDNVDACRIRRWSSKAQRYFHRCFGRSDTQKWASSDPSVGTHPRRPRRTVPEPPSAWALHSPRVESRSN